VVAVTRAAAMRTWPAVNEPRRRYIPALPTLWPGMLSPLASDRPTPFPFGAQRLTPFYFARNAVFHSVKLLGLEGREVLVPAYHHGVEIAALAGAGAVPRFVRVDDRMRLDVDALERAMGPRTGAIYVIHYAGFPQPMADVMDVARRRGLPVIEDCALALLSCDGARPLGSYGTVGIFCYYKTLPVPNGGALVVNDPSLRGAVPVPAAPPLGSTLSHLAGALLSNAAFRLGDAGERLRDGARRAAGFVRSTSGVRPVSTGTSTFDPGRVGLGMSGLSDLISRRVDHEGIVAARRRNYFLLLGRLRDRATPPFPELPPGVSPLFFPLPCADKSAVKTRLAARGIETVDFWRTGHALCDPADFPEVAALRERILEVPCHQDLGPEDMAWVARCVQEALE
jgi:hypothetical protein